MQLIRRRILLASVLALAAALTQGSAAAQYYYNPYAAHAQAQYNQQMWNAQMMSRAYNANPGTYNHNYYANPAAYSQSYYATPAVAAPSVGSFGHGDPYAYASMGNPYAPAMPGYGVSAHCYLPNPFYPHRGYDMGHGAYFMGMAELNRSYSNQLATVEQARLLREQYNQSTIETRKKQFDLEMYIKANTPTYTEKQAQAAKEVLKRIQTNSLPGEITSGRALNYLLEDLDKHKSKRSVVEPILLTESVLTRMNVASKTYGIGLLRDDGRLTWPAALKEILTMKERESLDTRIQTLVKDAAKGQLDNNALTDVSKEIESLRETLVKKVNDIPTSQYLDAKRFLQDFDQASIALGRGEAANQAKYQRFIEGGRGVHDLAEYLLSQGLRFGPATASDESAYRAVYSALAALDIAVNANVAVVGRE